MKTEFLKYRKYKEGEKSTLRRVVIMPEIKVEHLCACDEGVSLHRGVIVQWDRDHDTRVLNLLDLMPPEIIDKLLVIHEHKAHLYFLWADAVPEGYEGLPLIHETDVVYASFDSGDGDEWTVMESIAVSSQLLSDKHIF